MIGKTSQWEGVEYHHSINSQTYTPSIMNVIQNGVGIRVQQIHNRDDAENSIYPVHILKRMNGEGALELQRVWKA
jgi:hypothetical protein